MERSTSFLNVDLEVWSRTNLSALVKAFGGINLYNGRTPRGYFASFEISGATPTLDSTLRRLVQRARSLRGKARELWNGATRRDFNIGIQAREQPDAFELLVMPSTLRGVATLNGRLVVTVYGARFGKPNLEEERSRRSARQGAV